MTDPVVIEQARSSAKKILDALKIARVVCVDDLYEDAFPIEDVVIAACTLETNKLQELIPELTSIPDDKDVLKESIRRVWETIPDREARAEKILATARLLEVGEITEADDPGDASILSEVIPPDMLITLSPSEWKSNSERLLKEETTTPTLFLFDQDFSDAGGEKDAGIKIIAGLLGRRDSTNLICGLLTHTVTPDNQPQRWVELSSSYSIPRDRFLVIPKLYISKDPVLFAQLLKLVALSPDFEKLKDKTKTVIKDAALKAGERIEEISIYDLDHIVFRVSAEEGLWEPDMLFRLYSLYLRLESRRLAYEGGELESISSRMRSVSHIPTFANFNPESSTWKIQHSELYEPADHLNRNHLPLELGDIFEKTGGDSKKRFILLAQPCDLMVRNDGKRAPEIDHVPVAEITTLQAPFMPPQYSVKMEAFGETPKEQWFVKLKQVRQVHLALLDLCVFNSDGMAKITVGGDTPQAIRPSWKARHAILSKWAGQLVKKLDLLSPVSGDLPNIKQIKEKLKSQLSADLLNDGLFKGALTDQDGKPCVVYNCRRIGRLSRTRAYGLLMAYTAFLARPAYDVSMENSQKVIVETQDILKAGTTVMASTDKEPSSPSLKIDATPPVKPSWILSWLEKLLKRNQN